MGKLGCKCGAVLSDVAQEDSETYFGMIIPYGEMIQLEENASLDIASFVEAYIKGEKDKWLREKFDIMYPHDTPLREIISDIISYHNYEYGLCYGRCKKCRGLLVQSRKNSGFYNYYQPTDGESEGI